MNRKKRIWVIIGVLCCLSVVVLVGMQKPEYQLPDYKFLKGQGPTTVKFVQGIFAENPPHYRSGHFLDGRVLEYEFPGNQVDVAKAHEELGRLGCVAEPINYIDIWRTKAGDKIVIEQEHRLLLGDMVMGSNKIHVRIVQYDRASAFEPAWNWLKSKF